MDQVGAQIGLAIRLQVVEPHQRPAESDREQLSRARHTPRRATKRRGLIDQSTPENATAVSRPFESISRNESAVRRERAHVLGDALIGVGQFARHTQPVVHAVGEIGAHDPSGQPRAPEQAEAFLGEAKQHGRDRRGGEYREIEQRLVCEARGVALLDRGHEVAADVAVHHVQAIDREQEAEEHREEHARTSAHLALEEVPERERHVRLGEPAKLVAHRTHGTGIVLGGGRSAT